MTLAYTQKARRIAVNIAKSPELLQRSSSGGTA
jgi:hypothetical protein